MTASDRFMKKISDFYDELGFPVAWEDGGKERQLEISLKSESGYFVKAILAAEDDDFFNHSGVSYSGIIRSVLRILISGEVQGGGSTITMQVAGNYLTGRDINLFRKEFWKIFKKILNIFEFPSLNI